MRTVEGLRMPRSVRFSLQPAPPESSVPAGFAPAENFPFAVSQRALSQKVCPLLGTATTLASATLPAPLAKSRYQVTFMFDGTQVWYGKTPTVYAQPPQ